MANSSQLNLANRSITAEAVEALPQGRRPFVATPSTRLVSIVRTLRSEAARIVLLILVWKVVSFALVFLASSSIPFHTAQRDADFKYPPTESVSFSTSFTTWDSSRYLYLADHGYAPNDYSNWFPPLYPLLIRGLGAVLGDDIIAGLVISNVASTIGLYLFYMLVKGQFGTSTASRALLLFIAFPTAFFLNIVYTEALFLSLMMLVFFLLYRCNRLLASAAAFWLPLTRLTGFAIALPFAVFLVCDALAAARRDGVSPWRYRSRLLYLMGPFAGLVAYLLYMQLAAGDAFAASKTQAAFISHWDLWNVFDPGLLLHNLFGRPLVLHNPLDSALDRAFFAAFLLSLPLVYRRVDKTLFCCCLVLGLQPLLGSFMSYIRYVLLAFPLFVAYASWFAERSGRLLPRLSFLSVFMLMTMLQAAFIGLHVSNYWIA